ncbi:hypothetical protein JFL43_09495 [Viridibacillus sp. YIM B01967]|uniref:Lipoprotein n=1 Tax=Viridibacillus soli TaxID=2798301 RepID=A0ABS1H6P5_9BACL|nr:hypothetical protein [Viridibacillus soli]MBK3495086.1 hypothetical protein [Viridibacillus soli]
MKKYLYAGILLGTVMLAGCNENEETEKQGEVETAVLVDEQTVEVEPISNSDKNKVDSATPLKLTKEQKADYHKQYVKIVEEVNQRKLGMGLGVPPIEQFQSKDWEEPKAYEKMVQNMVDIYLAEEREALNAVSSTTNQVVTYGTEGTTKITHTYVMDLILPIEVTGSFETQYNAGDDRQLFAKVNNITSIAISKGKWEQTSYEASLIDGGRTYSIRIEGIHSFNGLSAEKAFTIEFNCNKVGGIS